MRVKTKISKTKRFLSGPAAKPKRRQKKRPEDRVYTIKLAPAPIVYNDHALNAARIRAAQARAEEAKRIQAARSASEPMLPIDYVLITALLGLIAAGAYGIHLLFAQ